MWVFDVTVLFVVIFTIKTCVMYVINWHVACRKSILTSTLGTQASFKLYLSGLHDLWRAWPLGFPTMLLATGRRPPSMSKGGMRAECGSNRRDGGRESRTREHGQGKGGKKGSAQRAAEVLLSKWSFCLAFYLSHKWENLVVGKNRVLWAQLTQHIAPASLAVFFCSVTRKCPPTRGLYVFKILWKTYHNLMFINLYKMGTEKIQT